MAQELHTAGENAAYGNPFCTLVSKTNCTVHYMPQASQSQLPFKDWLAEIDLVCSV